MRRLGGRRKTDRLQWAMGLVLGAVLATYGLYTSGCTQGGGDEGGVTVSGPSTPTAVSTPIPAPAPTATPGFDEPEGVTALYCEDNSTLRVEYNGTASQAFIETWWTSFDNQNLPFGLESKLVNKGGHVQRKFDVCRQGDARVVPSKELGGCFWDINGQPFRADNSASSNAKTKECRDRCTPTLTEVEEETGEWEDAPVLDSIGVTTVEEKCYKTQRRLVIVFEQNSCTQARRELRRKYITRQVEIPCPCVERGVEGVKDYSSPVWSGTTLQGACEYGPPQLQIEGFSESTITQCHENGTQAWREDYTCKDDVTGSINVCRSRTCPTPQATCANTAAFYKAGANSGLFNLGSSSDAAELGWVNSFVGLGPWEKFDDEGDKDNECTGADVSAKVVIVKAGSSQSATWSYRTYLNVTQGQQLCSYDPPGSDDGKDISHVTYFRCD